MNQVYWQGAGADEAMQDDHAFIWRAMLDAIDIELAGKRVLDAGCNRGGFLRLLADRCRIGQGFGYDPAWGAIEDARALAALVPGGVYYAVMGVHAASRLMAEWHRANFEQLHLPQLYDVDEVVAVFEAAGFDAAAARLPIRFVPARGDGHSRSARLLDWLDYYGDHKLLLRFSRATAG